MRTNSNHYADSILNVCNILEDEGTCELRKTQTQVTTLWVNYASYGQQLAPSSDHVLNTLPLSGNENRRKTDLASAPYLAAGQSVPHSPNGSSRFFPLPLLPTLLVSAFLQVPVPSPPVGLYSPHQQTVPASFRWRSEIRPCHRHTPESPPSGSHKTNAQFPESSRFRRRPAERVPYVCSCCLRRRRTVITSTQGRAAMATARTLCGGLSKH